jgi:phage terminase large subunit
LSILRIQTAQVFEPLLAPARYKGAFGGRGSGKSHFFGELLVETCQAERGTLAVCIREAQRTLAQSSKRLIEGKIASLGLGHGFKLFNDKIETPGDGLIIFRGMHHQSGLSALPAALSLGMAAYFVLAKVHWRPKPRLSWGLEDCTPC